MKNMIFTLLLFLQIFIFIPSFAQGWEEMKSLNNPTSFPVMAASNGKIYLLSGTQGTPAKTFEFNPETNTWTEKTSIPAGTIYASGVEVEGKIYVMGGLQNNQKTDLHYVFDPSTNQVSTRAALLTPRGYHNSATVNGKVYLIGGQNGDGTTEWYFDEYDPLNDSWLRKEQTPHNQAWYCGAVGVGNKFYRIAGGRWNVPTDYFDSYNPVTNIWEILDPFPITCHAPAAVALENKIYVMGGYNSEHKIDSIYTYYPSTKMWILSFVKLPEPLAYHKAVALGNYIYVYNKDEATSAGRLWRYKFGTVGIYENKSGNNEFNIAPNPSNGQIKLNFQDENNFICGIEVYDYLGNRIFQNSEVHSNSITIQIILKNPSRGIYLLRVNMGNHFINKSLLIE